MTCSVDSKTGKEISERQKECSGKVKKYKVRAEGEYKENFIMCEVKSDEGM